MQEAIFAVINGESQGPYTSAQLLAMVNSGQINAETLVWQEGMADWQPLNTVLAVPKKKNTALMVLLIAGGVFLLFLIAALVTCGIFVVNQLTGSRESAKSIHCVTNLKQIGTALYGFAIEHKEKYPNSLNDLKKDYLNDDSVYTCPSSDEAYEYINIGVYGISSDKVVARCRHHGNILYSDGSVRTENKK